MILSGIPFLCTLLVLLSVGTVHQYIHTQQQPHITPPKNSTFRDIVWGDLNFIHTTDTHGWYAGHLNQKQYSADWGDFISFTRRLKEIAVTRGSDILVVDTGDRHDGNGLSDATSPNGDISTQIFIQQDYDLVTLGNHELYKEEASIQEYEVTVSHFGERFVSSNVEYLLNNSTWVPFGNKYRYFKTQNRGLRVLALSFLFNFRKFNSKARVQPIEETLNESWFKELTTSLAETDIDVLVVYGHLPITDTTDYEINRLHDHLRRIYPNTIIQYLGGHSHIRDFTVFDSKSTGLQSGRYCETAGWISIGLNDNGRIPPIYNRRYIDFNRESFLHHTGLSAGSFDTEEGKTLSSYIADKRQELNLTESLGKVPSSYFMYQFPYGHENNIFQFLNSSILPSLNGVTKRDSQNRIILVNANSIRYDLYKGDYTKDTEFIVSPFVNRWNYLESVPKSLALKVEPFLNRLDYIASLSTPEKSVMSSRADFVEQKYKKYGLKFSSCPFTHVKGLKKGLTTTDDYGCDGDDVVHNTQDAFESPNIVQSFQEPDPNDEFVDVIYYDFIEPYILDALNVLSGQALYTTDDVKFYGGDSTGSLLTSYVKKHWSL